MNRDPKCPVFARDMADPEVGKALLEHAADRLGIIECLSASFEEDQRIRAAWLWGSFLRGDQDDLSDLDIWLIVPNGFVDEMVQALGGMCGAAGTVVTSGENAHNAPKNGGYFSALLAGSHGLQHLDIYWQTPSDCAVPDGPVLLNRLDEPLPPMRPQRARTAVAEETELEKCAGRISFVWLMLSVAAKYLARDPSSDMALMRYPKNSFEEVVAALGLQDQIGVVEWTASDGPHAKIGLLRHVALKTALLEKACRDRRLEISSEANPCLNRYFDLVEGILRVRLGET